MTDKASSKLLTSKAKETKEKTHTKNTINLNQKKIIMEKCKTRTTIASNLFHVIKKAIPMPC